LRVLSAEGLIRTKAGRNGGTFTTQPDGDRLARFVSLFVRGRRVTMRSLIEARTTLETSLAFYAARNRTAEDIAALEEACRLLEETPHGPEFARVNLAWHDAVAAASHNEILCAFLASIATSIARESAAAQEHVLEENATSEMRASVIYAHRRITEAVVAGDPETAKRRMERHLNAFSESIAAATESTEIEIP
jgi:DNA-binding FadR family transcriptional regulator